MSLLKKILNRSSIKDVMESLDNFKADTTSFKTFKTAASSYFGNNWKFNLEMHISSLPQNERAKYYLIFKNAIEYETATNYWASAVQLISLKKAVSTEDLKNLPNYEKYLSKFGTEGKKLYIKLKELFGVSKNEGSTSVKSDIGIKTIPQEQIIQKQESVLSSPKEISSSGINEEEYKKQIQKQIEEKLKILNKGATGSIPSVAKPIKQPTSSSNVTPADLAKNKIATPTNEIEWILNNFIRVKKSLPVFRDIMSAISLYKKAKSLEEYRGYIFLIDTLDYLIEQGKKILKSVPPEYLTNYFEGGVTELKQIITKYEDEKSKEMVLMQDIIKATEPEEKPYKNPYA